MNALREFRDDSAGSLLKLARWMWAAVHDYQWDPSEFDECFDRIYRHTDDLETLWQLGGATNDYLRRNPGAFAVPIELPRQLLASDDREARVIGLKLLNRCNVSITEITTEIERALNRADNYEDYGGLYELSNFLEQCHLAGVRLPPNVVERLVTAIDAFVVGNDESDQRVAQRQVECLRSLCG